MQEKIISNQMLANYQAKYRDKYGEETITIYNDGKTLWMVIRGVEFRGTAFDLLDPPANYDNSKQFSFFLDALCACEIDCDIPVFVVDGKQTMEGMLQVHFELGEPDETCLIRMLRTKADGTAVEANSGLGRELLQLELIFSDRSFKSQGKNLYDSFDEQLSEIKALLPEGIYLKTCWNCAFADYHPIGSGSFGQLACFRNTKEAYRKVQNKRDLMYLWEKRTEDVQEIYLCSEFEKRQPGIGGLYVG